jgi:hypothetical protein
VLQELTVPPMPGPQPQMRPAAPQAMLRVERLWWPAQMPPARSVPSMPLAPQ